MSSRKTLNIDVNTEIQEEFIEKIKIENEKYYNETGKRKKMTITTYGCQMNARDSEKLKGMLLKMGYEEEKDEKNSDLIVYNTCCVRENAENKVYGNLGYLKNLKEKNKNLKIILCGCMMQQDIVVDTIKKKYRHVDVIFGTYNLYRFPELLFSNMETKETIIDVWEEHKDIVEDLPTKREFKHKASVNIMFGCNNFCTYCIVPYVRGRERSRKTEDIIKEIKDLVNDGVLEVMLLGQNVNSYGNDLQDSSSFPNLLREINKIEGLKRVRFMTSHPKDMSVQLIEAIRDCDKICNHIHLPFQSGSTNILNLMNRKYTKEDYLNLIKTIKKEIPNVCLTTDIIVGFPTETEEDFLETLDVVEKVGYTIAFTFLYSKRTGTKACEMEQVDEKVAKERFNRLVDKLNQISLEINKKEVGKEVEVLAESVSKFDENYLSGRTEGNLLVHFESPKENIGKIVKVKIDDCKTFYLSGKLV